MIWKQKKNHTLHFFAEKVSFLRALKKICPFIPVKCHLGYLEPTPRKVHVDTQLLLPRSTSRSYVSSYRIGPPLKKTKHKTKTIRSWGWVENSNKHTLVNLCPPANTWTAKGEDFVMNIFPEEKKKKDWILPSSEHSFRHHRSKSLWPHQSI